MSETKDISKIENAIIEKYGKEVLDDFGGNWDTEKEKQYLKNLKKSYLPKEKENQDFLFSKILIIKQDNTCPVCKSYGLKKNDEVFMNKFQCCEKCYIKHVEGREEKWQERKKDLLKKNEDI